MRLATEKPNERERSRPMKRSAEIELGRDVLAEIGSDGNVAVRARRAISCYSELALEISLASIDEILRSADKEKLSKKELTRELTGLVRAVVEARRASTF